MKIKSTILKIGIGLLALMVMTTPVAATNNSISNWTSVASGGGGSPNTALVTSDGVVISGGTNNLERIDSGGSWSVGVNNVYAMAPSENGDTFYVVRIDYNNNYHLDERYISNGTIKDTTGISNQASDMHSYTDSNGNFRIITTYYNGQTRVYDDSLTQQWTGGSGRHIAIDRNNNEIYIAGSNLYRYDYTGTQQASTNGYSNVRGAGIGENGNLYIGEASNDYIREYDSSLSQVDSTSVSYFIDSLVTANGEIIVAEQSETVTRIDESTLSEIESAHPYVSGRYLDAHVSQDERYWVGVNNGYDETQAYQINTIDATSLDVSIEGNSNSYNNYGTDNFEVNATVTLSDGSTQDVSEDSSSTYTYNSTQLNQLSPKDIFEGNSPGSDTLTVEYTDSNGNTVSDSITVNTEDKTQSVDVSISGNSNSYTTTGARDFTVTTTRTLYDGTTQTVSTDVETGYSYNSTQLNFIGGNTFEGENLGTDTLTTNYNDPFSGNLYQDDISITVQDPKQVSSVELTGLPNEMDEGDTESLTATVTYDDGSTEVVTTDTDTTYQSSNTTRLTVDTDGNVDALYWGDATVSVEYDDTWFGNTYSDSATTTILGDPSSVDFTVSNTQPRVNDSVDMSATLNYEDGRTKDVSSDISATTVVSNKPARTDFDFTNTSVSFNDDVNFTLTFSNTYQGVSVSDDVTVDVKPARNYNYFNALSPVEQVWVIFTDWSLLAIFASVAVGGGVSVKYGGSEGLATTTILLGLSWVGGLVSIFVPATLILFEIFAITVMNIQTVDW